jgi:hypothetical protein
MKPVLKHIFGLKRDYAKLPFFDFLRDGSIPGRERLGFFPCMASFIMSFGDLNRLVLREEPTDDPYLKIINAHTYEDDHHWPWYLEDYTKLGHDDAKQAPGDTIRFLYSDATIQNRLLAHRLAHLIWGAEPVVRLAIIEAIEETGHVLFQLTSKIAMEIEKETGTELRYCGEFHFNLESGHAMNNDHAELALIELTDAQREDALERVERVFEWFTLWTDELLAFAIAAQPRRELAEA